MTTHVDKLESILRTLDQVTRMSELAEVKRHIARGFCEIGAIMTVLLVHEGEALQVAARWPEERADELFRRLRGGELSDFEVPLARTTNNYVRVFRSKETLVLDGPAEVADHIASTYDLPDELKDQVAETLTGAAGAVIPMVADDEAVGVLALNYREDLAESDRHLFNIFARSAATLLRFKREVVSREAILEDLERALAKERQTRAELNRAERLAALGEMAAVVAHEIRNPVAIIKNSACSLRKAISDTPQERMLCDIIAEETESIDRIIDDMLAFSQPLERGGGRAAVGDIIAKAVSLLGQRAHRTAIDIDVACPEGEDVVAVDAHRVTHAVVNLLINARQATTRSGSVRVRAHPIEVDGARFVRIEVSDTGAGIPGDLMPTVFEPFITTKDGGTGLGLSIVKRTVDAHGGRVTIDSTEGEGTTVNVDLPIAGEPL